MRFIRSERVFALLMEALAGVAAPGKIFLLSLGPGRLQKFSGFLAVHVPSLGDEPGLLVVDV